MSLVVISSVSPQILNTSYSGSHSCTKDSNNRTWARMFAVWKNFNKPHILRVFNVNGSPSFTLSMSSCSLSLHSNTIVPAKHQVLAIREVKNDSRRKHVCLVITTHTIHRLSIAYPQKLLKFKILQQYTCGSHVVPLKPRQKTQIFVKLWNEWHEMKAKEEMVYLQLVVRESVHLLACMKNLKLREILHYTR